MVMTCPECKTPVPDSERSCPACQKDIGFPNVRAALRPEEKLALAQRVHDAEVSAKARNCSAVLEDFGRAVLTSKAVLCRSLSILQSLISSENTLYVSFYRNMESGSR